MQTNIRGSGKKHFTSFHWLESWSETIDEKTGNPTGMTITLPDWLYAGITERGGGLTIHEDYFLRAGGIEHWMYRVARKHAGSQERGWSLTMRQLFEKSGSAARFSDFAIDIRQAVQSDQLPEYQLFLIQNSGDEECIHFVRRVNLRGPDPEREFQRHPRRRLAEGIFTGPHRLGSRGDRSGE